MMFVAGEGERQMFLFPFVAGDGVLWCYRCLGDSRAGKGSQPESDVCVYVCLYMCVCVFMCLL